MTFKLNIQLNSELCPSRQRFSPSLSLPSLLPSQQSSATALHSTITEPTPSEPTHSATPLLQLRTPPALLPPLLPTPPPHTTTELLHWPTLLLPQLPTPPVTKSRLLTNQLNNTDTRLSIKFDKILCAMMAIYQS